MKVAWVHNFSKHGPQGTGVFMWQLRDALQNKGITIKDISLGSLRSPKNILNTIPKIQDQVRECDLIHVQFGSVCGFVGSRLRGKKILSLRGSDWHTVPFKISAPAYLHGVIAKFFTKQSLAGYDHIITMSERMKDEVKYYKNDHVTVIPSGINFNKFIPMDRMECRAKLNKKNDTRPWVLFSSVTDGNALKRKELALAAVEEAKKKLPDIHVRYLNNVPHDMVSTHINAANTILLTSTHEGWPNIIKEGLACDIPFVSTDVSDLKKITENTQHCYVTNPTPEMLGAALVKSLTGSQETGLKNLIIDMEISHTVKTLTHLYKSVLE